jgi:hypothetical protein
MAPDFKISQFQLLGRDRFNYCFVPSSKSQGRESLVQFMSSAYSKPSCCGHGCKVTVSKMVTPIETIK